LGGRARFGALAIGDADGDGQLDVAVIRQVGPNRSIVVLRNTGGGSFVEVASIPVANNTVDLTTGDFNGDGTIDLAAAHDVNPPQGAVSVILNDGTASYPTKWNLVGPVRPTSLTSADVDGNGTMDIVTGNDGGGMSVLLNDGAGNFTVLPPAGISGNDDTRAVIADFDGDGDVDVATSRFNQDMLTIFTNN